MEFNFKHKRALVTGAGKGIGRAIAVLLARCGATVIALSRTKADLDALQKEINCITIVADLGEVEDVKRAAEEAGEIDFLVNNAGISILEPFLETKPESFTKVLNTNVLAVLLLSQSIAKKMVSRGAGGSIVNLSSQASLVALKDHASYCASKGALDQLTRVMALELGPHNIRVNAVNPTVTLTPMGEMAWSDPSKSAPMLSRIPLNKFAKPEDIAKAVVFLLSDHASMITGAVVPVDGGYTAT